MPLTEIPTDQLIAELLKRKSRKQADIAKIERSLGELNTFQLDDARTALDMAIHIAKVAQLPDPFVLLERNRDTRCDVPRKVLHWALHVLCKWPMERVAMHCERDKGSVLNSVRCVAAQPKVFAPIIVHLRSRLQS